MAMAILSKGTGVFGQIPGFVHSLWTTNKDSSWEEFQIKNGSKYHVLKDTKETYSAETPDWALAKAFAISYMGSYYFGFRCARHTLTAAYQTGKAFFEIIPNYLVLKKEQDFDLRVFLEGELHHFDKAKNNVIQAGKEFLCFAPFYFNFYGIPFYIQAVALAYAAYNPLMARVYWNKVEEFVKPHMVESVAPLNVDRIKHLSVLKTIDYLTDGTLSLAQWFNMDSLGMIKPKDQSLDQPVLGGEAPNISSEDPKKKKTE